MPEAQEATPAEGEKPEASTTPKEGEKPQATEGQKPEAKTFDESYVKELRSEAARNRKAAQEAASKLQEYEDAQKSELEKAQSKLSQVEKEKAEAVASLLRYAVAAEKEVPPALVPLLTALSREDLEAQADLIVENAKPKPTSMDGGVRENAEQPKTPEDAHRDFLMGVFGKPTTPTT